MLVHDLKFINHLVVRKSSTSLVRECLPRADFLSIVNSFPFVNCQLSIDSLIPLFVNCKLSIDSHFCQLPIVNHCCPVKPSVFEKSGLIVLKPLFFVLCSKHPLLRWKE
jgi:hypothetical protein